MGEQGSQEVHGFQFNGRGTEYFKIWIVNVLLTILTLGIYSAWAKVRRLQYFYRNTQLAGAGFDYHGTPQAILKGRIIAFVLLVAYNAAFQFNPLLGAVIALLLALVMPWLLMRSLRFKLTNSSYRGLRFGFAGKVRDAYRAFLKYPALAGLTAYLLAPLAHQRIKQYQFSNSRFGNASFGFGASARSFYGIYLSFLAVMAGAILLAVAVFRQMEAVDPQTGMLAAGLTVSVFFVLATTLFMVYIQNLVWNDTRLGAHQFSCNLSARRVLWIGATNFLGILLTFGLYKPFATVRMLRYKLESMSLVAEGGLSAFVAGQQQQAGASGEEAAEMFDVDISF